MYSNCCGFFRNIFLFIYILYFRFFCRFVLFYMDCSQINENWERQGYFAAGCSSCRSLVNSTQTNTKDFHTNCLVKYKSTDNTFLTTNFHKTWKKRRQTRRLFNWIVSLLQDQKTIFLFCLTYICNIRVKFFFEANILNLTFKNF